MAQKYTPKTLVSADRNREWTTESAEQETNLRARGWSPKAEEADQADKAAAKTTSK